MTLRVISWIVRSAKISRRWQQFASILSSERIAGHYHRVVIIATKQTPPRRFRIPTNRGLKMRRLMNPLKLVCLVMFVYGLIALQSNALAQQTAANPNNQPLSGANTLSPAQIDKIIVSFTAKETQFRRALNSYAFKRDALIQVLGMGGQVAARHQRAQLPVSATLRTDRRLGHREFHFESLRAAGAHTPRPAVTRASATHQRPAQQAHGLL